MTVGSPTLAEIVARFLTSIVPEERGRVYPELNRFVRWFGPEQPLEAIDARALESYQEQVASSGADQTRRLEPVRALLTYAQRQGLVSGNLAKYIKLKRTGGRRDSKGEITFQEEVTHLTPEGYAKLKDELDRLITVERPKVAQALWEARQDKDIRENAPYDAAKQHQALVEARIRELERLIATANIIDTGRFAGDRITVGSKVVLRDLSHDEELNYTLVGPQEANPRTGKISIASPVGKALLDHFEGDTVEVEALMGKMRYRIEKIER
jgi:transcription elongation factor GreA